MELEGTERYYLDPELGAIVNMALVMEKPLLLTGEVDFFDGALDEKMTAQTVLDFPHALN